MTQPGRRRFLFRTGTAVLAPLLVAGALAFPTAAPAKAPAPGPAAG